MVCEACSEFFRSGFGKHQWGGVGVLYDEAGKPIKHGPTEPVSRALHDVDEAGNLYLVREWVEEQPTPKEEDGQPVHFQRGYTRHEVRGGRGRPSELPDAYLLAGLQEQLLVWLDHLATVAPHGQWGGHVQRTELQGVGEHPVIVGGSTDQARWLRELAKRAADAYQWGSDGRPKMLRAKPGPGTRFRKEGVRVEAGPTLTTGAAGRLDRRGHWKRDRKAIARILIAHILGEDPNDIRSRLDRWKQRGGLAGFRKRGGLG